MPSQNDNISLHNAFGKEVRLAASAKWFEFPDKFDYLERHSYAVEYTPDMNALTEFQQHVSPYLQRDVEIRHHAFFPGFELADVCVASAEKSVDVHRRFFESMAGLGEMVATVHIGLDPKIELCPIKAVDNLTRIVEIAKCYGIVVSLENLRRGMTSDPTVVLDWARRSGSAITLDIGHALSSDFMRYGGPDIFEIIEIFAPFLAEVHFYEKETDRHYGPSNMTVLGPIAKALLATTCDWWTIELGDVQEIELCRRLIREYLLR